MKLRQGDKENLKHPMTWVAIGGIAFWLALLATALFGYDTVREHATWTYHNLRSYY